jgi:hypothetical protein
LKEIEKYVANFTPEQGKLSIIAHSYAGTIVQAALESGWKFHRIILLATTFDENFDFSKYDKQFDAIKVYWSPADQITPHSTYGMQGKVGVLKPHPRVFSHEWPATRHFDWINPPGLELRARDWADFLEYER